MLISSSPFLSSSSSSSSPLCFLLVFVLSSRVLRFQIRCLATALYCLHWLNLMGFFVEESGLIVTHLLYKAALVLAVLRWALAWALRFKNRTHLASPSNDSLRQSHPVPSSQQIRDGLILTTFGDVTERMPGVCDTCAVCLSQLRDQDKVRELRNCCHVFHRDCIDRWVDHDHEHDENHNTCPLCRAPLLTTSQSLARTRAEPSWAVERILYLFGDDLVMWSSRCCSPVFHSLSLFFNFPPFFSF